MGEAGAPVLKSEASALRKAYELLYDELDSRAHKMVESGGLIRDSSDGLELACIDDRECVFAVYNAQGVALCSIQRAFYQNRITFEKPLSCHLFPIRITNIGSMDFLNFEFVPEICSPGAKYGKESDTYLAEYLESPLTRKYGAEWYREFISACQYIRSTSTDTAVT